MRMEVTLKNKSHLGVFLRLMQGEFDGRLKWPFRGHITVHLLSQSDTTKHHIQVVRFSETSLKRFVGRTDTVGDAYGYSEFIAKADLKHSSILFMRRPKYLKDDSLRFLVSTELQSDIGVPPLDFVMTNFEEHKRQGLRWCSAPFYSHSQGYKMRAFVRARGDRHHLFTDLEVGVFIMMGDYDSRLSWPFRGHIAIQVRNQLSDSGHMTEVVRFTERSLNTGERVRKSDPNSLGGWVSQPFTKEQCGPMKYQTYSTQFVKNNSLNIRVLRVEPVPPPMKSIGNGYIIVSNFQRLKKDGDVFYSPAFYSSERGYKMCLSVYPNGTLHGRGTHVSVYLHLMRGEYDSYVRWPLLGGFEFEFINHNGPLNLGHKLNVSSPLNRLTNCDISGGYGLAQCLPHSFLEMKKKRQYIKDDCLHIRMLYLSIQC